jgi:hypothetical protein
MGLPMYFGHDRRGNMTFSINRFFIAASIILIASLFASGVSAEQKKVLGDWDVHYIVIPSTFLTPEVAKANNIRRSATNALVNISVLDSRTKAALDVEVNGNARNLIGSTKELSFNTVTEGEAIYHLATVVFDDKEVLRYEINLKQGNTTQVLTFQQKMYANE